MTPTLSRHSVTGLFRRYTAGLGNDLGFQPPNDFSFCCLRGLFRETPRPHGIRHGLHSIAATRLSSGLAHPEDCMGYPPCSIATVIFAVFASMAETEQYFSFDNWTASSMALVDTLPPTR